MTLSDFEIEMAGRLLKFREELKIKQKEVAEGSGSSQSHISDMEKGKKQIQPRVIFYLVDKHLLNVNWLYTGRGEMQQAGGEKAGCLSEHDGGGLAEESSARVVDFS